MQLRRGLHASFKWRLPMGRSVAAFGCRSYHLGDVFNDGACVAGSQTR